MVSSIEKFIIEFRSRMFQNSHKGPLFDDRGPMPGENMEKTGPLKKVVLSVEAGSEADSMDITPSPRTMEFIFGLGPNGLTPLESELSNKGIGYEVIFRLKEEDMPHLFHHLSPPYSPSKDNQTPFYMKLRIMDITPADQRDVIKSLAEMAECGDHCCGH
jgi:hypothetical protein